MRPSPLPPIAFDAAVWDEPTTGIGLYTRCLASGLEAEGASLVRCGARESGEFPRGALGHARWTAGILPSVLERAGCPLFHALGNFNLPLTRVGDIRYVLTVHDLIPELLPDTVSKPYHWQFRLWLHRSLMLADRIICVSDTTRKALLARHQVDPDRVVVIHHGIDHVERASAPSDAELDALDLPEEFVLFAGSLDARKNVSCVLEAMRRLNQSGKRVPLVLIGQKWFGSGPAEARLEALRAEGCAIHPLGYQPEGVLYAVMRRAKLFVFPSRYEGFGLPPLEAMWQGTPVVISTAEALREVCGDAALQVDPDSPEALAAAIARLWGSQKERARLSEAGRRHARNFTWAKAARETLEVYRSALKGPPLAARGETAMLPRR